SMPSILAEVGFVSNPREETQLSRAAYRQRLAEALYQGVARYANSLSHFTLAEGGSPKSRGMGRGEDTDSK
ncbi:MAG TPA: N-acetylmuramoyl-L-alanine amidase, partial [Solibacterales bacterium]|nr:N-acetylmuramoyl-L-alanine amidase [Bryobacterales bacterium]